MEWLPELGIYGEPNDELNQQTPADEVEVGKGVIGHMQVEAKSRRRKSSRGKALPADNSHLKETMEGKC